MAHPRCVGGAVVASALTMLLHIEPVIKDVVEADQQGQRQVAALQLLHQLHKIEGAARL